MKGHGVAWNNFPFSRGENPEHGRQFIRTGKGCHLGLGAALPRLDLLQGRRLIQGLEQRQHQLRLPEPFPEVRQREEIRRLVDAIHLPAHQALAAQAGAEVAGGRPQYPALVRRHEEAQELPTIRGAIPAEGAIRQHGDGHAAILAQDQTPHGGRRVDLPALDALGRVGPQVPVRTQEQRRTIRSHTEAPGRFGVLQWQGLAVQGWMLAILPPLHAKARGLDARGHAC